MEPVDTLNVTRIAALLAGIPDTVPAVTINRGLHIRHGGRLYLGWQ